VSAARWLHRGGEGAQIVVLQEGGVAERELLVFADYTCPFCILAEAGLGRLRADGVRVEAGAFELRPAGTPLPSPDEGWMREGWDRVVAPLAAELGVEMRYPTFMTRSRKAHEAAAFARAEGALEPMQQALYAAYWRDGRDIGRIDVLTDIAGEIGLDRGAMRVALDIDSWSERVAEDRAQAARLRLTGVPAYVDTARGAVLVGLQRYHELRTWVTQDDV
jgi:predicted DsbA family dithiol-disulfide isomerase